MPDLCPLCQSWIGGDGRIDGGTGYDRQPHGCDRDEVDEARKAAAAELRARLARFDRALPLGWESYEW